MMPKAQSSNEVRTCAQVLSEKTGTGEAWKTFSHNFEYRLLC